MSQSPVQSILKKIHESFQDALSAQPAYGEMLPFFETLFEIQEAAVGHTHPKTPAVEDRRLQLVMDGEFPLVDRHKLDFDQPAALRLIKIICEIAQMSNEKLRHAADVIKHWLTEEETLISYGLRRYAAGDEVALARLSRKLEIERDALAFFFHHTIWPSVARMARDAAERYALNGHWKKGNCPICGAMPFIASLSENGQRSLVCGFCRHQWSVDRIFCPSCSNRDPKSMGYFFCEAETAYRVDTCDQCKGYIKTVDRRKLRRYFYPPLENIVTSHLDIRAETSGYRPIALEGSIQ